MPTESVQKAAESRIQIKDELFEIKIDNSSKSIVL